MCTGIQFVRETHTEFAVLLPRCAAESDSHILRQLQVDSLFTFYLHNHGFLTVYKKCHSISLQAHSQLYPLLPGEGVSPREVKAGEALTSSSPGLVVQTQGVVEGGGDDLENRG